MIVISVFVFVCLESVFTQSVANVKGIDPAQSVVQVKGFDPCSINVKAGNCKAYFPSFYFNPDTNQCECFVYTGCGGNENRFNYIEECIDECGVAPKKQRISDLCRTIFDGTKILDNLLETYETPLLDIDIRHVHGHTSQAPQQTPSKPDVPPPHASHDAPSTPPDVSSSQAPQQTPSISDLHPPFPFPSLPPSRVPFVPSIISSVRPSRIASKLVEFFRPATHSWQRQTY